MKKIKKLEGLEKMSRNQLRSISGGYTGAQIIPCSSQSDCQNIPTCGTTVNGFCTTVGICLYPTCR